LAAVSGSGEDAQLEGESWPAESHQWVTEEADGRKTFDQLQYVIDTLSDSPNSRRLVVNAWHPANAAVPDAAALSLLVRSSQRRATS